MKPEYRKIFMTLTIPLLFMSICTGQPKSLGSTFSLSGIALSYEHITDYESFFDISIKAECGDMFFGKAVFPGVTGSFTWNHIFARKESRNGNDIRFFAGPGLTFGWCNDLLKPIGYMFGLKGRVGAECEFDRHVILSASLSPTIGTHIRIFDDHVDMRYYRLGIISALMPEIGIRYAF